MTITDVGFLDYEAPYSTSSDSWNKLYLLLLLLIIPLGAIGYYFRGVFLPKTVLVDDFQKQQIPSKKDFGPVAGAENAEMVSL